VQQALMRFLLQTVIRIQQVTGWRLLFLSVDDALAPKDVATTALEAVTFHHDHVEQRQQKKQYTNASRYVTVHLQLGTVQIALAWRLYLSRKQVQRLRECFLKGSGRIIEWLNSFKPTQPTLRPVNGP
jgi:hypothetical protein